MEGHEQGVRLAAAAYHHAALLHHANQSWEEAHALVSRSLRLREDVGDEEGRSYGLAVRAACERAMEQMTEAIDTQMERLGVLERLDDQEGVMETLADLAHLHATIGEVDLASDHLNRSLQLAKDMGDLSGTARRRMGPGGRGRNRRRLVDGHAAPLRRGSRLHGRGDSRT